MRRGDLGRDFGGEGAPELEHREGARLRDELRPGTPRDDSQLTSGDETNAGTLSSGATLNNNTSTKDPVGDPSPFHPLRRLDSYLASGTLGSGSEELPSLDSVPRMGRYALREVIGRGGMGVVYRATDPTLGRDVAIKFIGTAASLSARGRERFLREARAVARLDHPHIVRLYDAGQWRGLDFFVMRLVKGPTLAQRIAEGPMEIPQALAIGIQLGQALACAHARGLIHRDVKPGNVLLCEDGSAVLTDFGVARDLADVSTRLTRDSVLIGTPAYMAPEQLLPTEKVGPPADQFALAVVLWEMITGRRPNKPAGDDGRRRATLPPMSVPEGLRRVCTKAMATHPQDRYETVDAMVCDMERCLGGMPVLATPPARSRVIGRWLRARRDGLIIAAVGVSMLLLVLWGLGFSMEAHQRSRLEAAASERLAAALKRAETFDRQDQREEADAALLAFTRRPDNLGTRALAQGWLARASRARRAGDFDTESDSLARAYGAARHETELGAAIVGLAHHLRTQWAWDSLAELIDTAAMRMPSLAVDPTLRQLSGEAAFARRDFAGAASIWQQSQGQGHELRLADVFLEATRTEHVLSDGLAGVFHPPKGPAELWLTSGDASELRRLGLADAQLPMLGRHAVPGERSRSHRFFTLTAAADQPAELVVWRLGSGQIGRADLLRLQGEQLVTLHSWESEQIGDALSADLDGDGVLELYVGTLAYQRDMSVLRPSPGGGYTIRVAHPPTNLAASDVSSLQRVDLDEDGRDELAVAASAWSAYDVRLLEPNDAGELELKARIKLGTVVDLVPLPGSTPRLAALKVDLFPNPEMFSPARPFGAPAGVYLLRLQGGELVVDDFIAFNKSWSPRALMAADVDGDGLRDLIMSTKRLDLQRTLIYLQHADGGFSELSMVGVQALAAANMDDDPAAELVVSVVGDGRHLWVLGAGEQQIPVLARPSPEREALIEDDVVQSVWVQAEDLAAIGLVDSAVDLLREIASQTLNPETIAAAFIWGGELLRESGRLLAAAKMYEDAALPSSTRRAEALANAALVWQSINALEPALAAIERLEQEGGLTDRERARWRQQREEILARLGDSRSWRLDLSQPLDDAWRVERDSGMRWQQASTSLSLGSVDAPSTAPIAWLPVEWDGDPFTLEAEMTVERLEWGASLSIGLRSPQGGFIGVGARGWGGRAQLYQDLGCMAQAAQVSVQLPVEGPEVPRRIALRLDVMEPDNLRCTLTDVASGVVLAERVWSAEIDSPGRWRLELGEAVFSYIGPLRARATLHSLRVQGVRRVSGTPGADAWYRARLLLANGDAQTALAMAERGELPGAPAQVSLLRHRALLDLGRPAEAMLALADARDEGLIDDPALGSALLVLVRERPDQLGPLLREALGFSGWIHRFAEAWLPVAVMHQGDPTVRSALGLALGPAISPDLVRGDTADVVGLLIARGHSRLLTRDWGAARGDVASAMELLERSLEGEPRSAAEVNLRRKRLSECRSMMAELSLAVGDVEQALGYVQQAIVDSPAPEIAADRLAATPGLSSLHDHPQWRALVGPEGVWGMVSSIHGGR